VIRAPSCFEGLTSPQSGAGGFLEGDDPLAPMPFSRDFHPGKGGRGVVIGWQPFFCNPEFRYFLLGRARTAFSTRAF